MEAKPWLLRSLPVAAMVAVECLDVGLTTLSKAAMSRGMSRFVFLVYSNALASLLLFPLSFIGREKRPPLTFSVLCKFFFLALVGITAMQNCVFAGVSYSSPTLASAMGNLVPAFTFLLAVSFRIETLNLRSSRSQIKILGTVVSISGALIVTLYKGPVIGGGISAVPYPDESLPTTQPNKALLADVPNWVIGGMFLAAAGLSLATWNTAQAAVLKSYPSEVTLVSFCCFFGTLQCAVVALIAERDPKAWNLGPSIELIAVIYAAIVGNVVTFCVCSWCIHKKGPTFVAMFKPLSIGIAAMMGAIFLGDTLHVGSIVGAVVIVAGFYGVIWAMSQEEEDGRNCTSGEVQSPSQKTPLIESHVYVN
ncbi:hypothetical protein BT93_B0158 [Corymbia citriodora subsp. variegata]|nr:hypothetical protein BT93_B0158 [Corymbia citriodora subsp. variegata]